MNLKENNPFIWHELVTSNQDKSGEFFCKLLGWQNKQVDAGHFGTYTIFKSGENDVAGMMTPTSDTPYENAYWHSYIAIDDIEKCAKQAIELGGSLIVPPHDVPDIGRICIVGDPMGAIAHLMQPI